MNRDLTILLLLKDRTPFTWRWMNYYNQIGLPFKVLIADGGKDKSIEKLADKSLFPNIDYEYIRYPYDENLGAFFKKIWEALSRVKTKYVVLASNDDFYFTDVLIDSVNFLDANSDYSTARGDIYNFTVKQSKKITGDKDVYGIITDIYKLYFNTSNTASTAMERIEIFSQFSNSLWHDVSKTDELKEFYKNLYKLKIDDLKFADYFISTMTVAGGKIYRGPGLYMLHQYQPDSISVASKNDPFEWILSESWPLNLFKMANAISLRISRIDNIPKNKAGNKFIQYYVANSLGKNMVASHINKMTLYSSFNILNLSHIFSKDNIIRKTFKNIYVFIKNQMQETKNKEIIKQSSYYKNIEVVKNFLLQKN